MSVLLKRCAGMLIAGAALLAGTLFVFPAAAEAQEDGGTNRLEGTQSATQNANATMPLPPASERATHLVVPGDSLWSVAQERLGPNPAPQQIASEVEKIFELNRDHIGDDPNLILPGQQLSLDAAAEPAPSTPAVAETAAMAEEPVLAEQQPVDEHVMVAERPLAPAEGEPIVLPDLPDSKMPPLVAHVGTFTELHPSAEPNNDGRRLVGLGFLALSFGAAVLLVLLLLAKGSSPRKGGWIAVMQTKLLHVEEER